MSSVYKLGLYSPPSMSFGQGEMVCRGANDALRFWRFLSCEFLGGLVLVAVRPGQFRFRDCSLVSTCSNHKNSYPRVSTHLWRRPSFRDSFNSCFPLSHKTLLLHFFSFNSDFELFPLFLSHALLSCFPWILSSQLSRSSQVFSVSSLFYFNKFLNRFKNGFN